MTERVAIKTAYITLAQLLKIENIISSGGQAKSFLAEHSVMLNGQDENRRGKKLYPGDQIDLQGHHYLIDQESAAEKAEEAEKKAILARFASRQQAQSKSGVAGKRRSPTKNKNPRQINQQKPTGPGSWN